MRFRAILRAPLAEVIDALVMGSGESILLTLARLFEVMTRASSWVKGLTDRGCQRWTV